MFDALTHERSYMDGWPVDQAVAEILVRRPVRPDVVEVFMDLDPNSLIGLADRAPGHSKA